MEHGAFIELNVKPLEPESLIKNDLIVTEKIIIHNNRACKLDWSQAKKVGINKEDKSHSYRLPIDYNSYKPTLPEKADWLFIRRYTYRFQPLGETLTPLGGMDREKAREFKELYKVRAKERAEERKRFQEQLERLKQEEEKKKESELSPEQKENLEEEIRYRKENIKYIQKHIQSLDDRLAKAKTPKEREDLQYLILRRRADMQVEKDQIYTLKIGQFVRTRTAWDEMAKAQFIAQSQEIARKASVVTKTHKSVERLIKKLPEDEQESMRDFVRNQLKDDYGNLNKIREVGRLVGDKLVGIYEAESADYEAIAEEYDRSVTICEYYQKAANIALLACPFVAGGSTLAIVYGVTSGAIDGYHTGSLLGEEHRGITGAAVGAATTALRFWSPKIHYAVSFIEGYQQDGLMGGLENMAISYVYSKAMQVGVKAAGKGFNAFRRNRFRSRRTSLARRQSKLNSWRDAKRRHDFLQERSWGKKMVEEHFRVYNELKSAKRNGAFSSEIVSLRGTLNELTAAIKHTPHAKGYLKYNAPPKMQKAYNATDRWHTNKVVGDLKTALAKQGFNTQELKFQAMRNSGNTSPGMDLDLAMFSSRGNKVTYTDPQTGKTTYLDLYKANQIAQKTFDKVYAQNSGGRSARASWQMVTTDVHLEAYHSEGGRLSPWIQISALKEQGVGLRATIDPKYAGDAARVTQHKAYEMRHQPGVSTDNQNWEIYRGTSKDIDTKLLPQLEEKYITTKDPKMKKSLKQSMDFYKRLSKGMKSANYDPVEAEQKLLELTGYRPLDIVNMVSAALE
ncbi:hypothetical protein ACFLQ1_02670, partial [Candidatus Auribacterota bacterium]